MIALVSANFGGIDKIKSLPAIPEINSFYYTDSGAVDATGWNIIYPDFPNPDVLKSHRLTAAFFKAQIHRLDYVKDADWLVWADASFQFHSLKFILDEISILQNLQEKKRFLAVPHPERRTVADEIDFVKGWLQKKDPYLTSRYTNINFTGIKNHFENKGLYCEDMNLWAGGFWIAHNNLRNREFFDMWWNCAIRFGHFDQLSMDGCFKICGIEPQRFEVNIYQNKFFTRIHHP